MSWALRWNRIRYSLWAPLYDPVTRLLDGPRRRSVSLLRLAPGERVVLIGAGTGLDLPLLPPGLQVLATDLTPAMLSRARPRAGPGVELRVMDAQRLALPDASFDAAVLHLIVAVVPDPVACLREAARVVRPGGRLAVFDKFAADDRRVGWPRRALNALTAPLFTTIDRQLGALLERAAAPLAIEHDEPALRGLYRTVILRRLDGRPPAP